MISFWILANRFFQRVVWISVRRAAWIPIVKDASKKVDSIFRKALLQGKQCFASGMSSSSDEHDAIRKRSNHTGISNLHCRRRIHQNEIEFFPPLGDEGRELARVK